MLTLAWVDRRRQLRQQGLGLAEFGEAGGPRGVAQQHSAGQPELGGAAGVRVRVDEFEGLAQQGEAAVGGVVVAGGAGGVLEDVDQRGAAVCLGVGQAFPHVQGAVEEAQLLPERVAVPRVARSGEECGQRTGRVLGGPPVDGDAADRLVGRDEAGVFLQRAGERGVAAHAFTREEVVEGRFAHEGVAERVAVPVARGGQDVRADRRAQGGVERVRVEPGVVGGDLGEQSVRDGRAADRGQAYDLLRRFG